MTVSPILRGSGWLACIDPRSFLLTEIFSPAMPIAVPVKRQQQEESSEPVSVRPSGTDGQYQSEYVELDRSWP